MTDRPDEMTLRKALQLMHHVATGQSDRAYMSIPADPKRDADLLLSAAIDELVELRAAQRAVRDVLSGLLGQRHVLDGVFGFIERWADDPVFADKAQREHEIGRCRAAMLEWHKRLVAASAEVKP